MKTHIVISDGSHSRHVYIEPLNGGRDGYRAYAYMPWSADRVCGYDPEAAIDCFLKFSRSGGWLAYPYRDYNEDVKC